MEVLDPVVYLWVAAAFLGSAALIIMVFIYIFALFKQTLRRLKNEQR